VDFSKIIEFDDFQFSLLLLKAQAVRVQAAQVLFITASFPFAEVEFLVW
jgi:hypothetical protein